MDVYEYFQSRERECRDRSLVPETSFDDLFGEEEGSDGQRGLIFGRLGMTPNAFLSISEEVEVVGSGIHRVSYSYYLVVDGVEAWGYDRDPSHDPAEHKHFGAKHRRLPCGRVTFVEIADRAWETVSLNAETEPPPE